MNFGYCAICRNEATGLYQRDRYSEKIGLCDEHYRIEINLLKMLDYHKPSYGKEKLNISGSVKGVTTTVKRYDSLMGENPYPGQKKKNG